MEIIRKLFLKTFQVGLEFPKMLLLLENHRTPNCLIEDPLETGHALQETDMPDRRPIGDRHVSSETNMPVDTHRNLETNMPEESNSQQIYI